MPVTRIAFVLIAAAFAAQAQDQSQSPVPDNLRVPPGLKLLFRVHAVGDQIYTCKQTTGAYAWALKAPDAQLITPDGKPFGHHFAGPAWEAVDGSRVIGKLAASAPSPDPASIPWLLLNAVGHDGSGRMSNVLAIQRLNTKAGKAPSSACDGSQPDTHVHYEADYLFYGK